MEEGEEGSWHKCPRCKKFSTLVSLSDDGIGKRMCKGCKRKYKKAFPNKDYRFAEKKEGGENGKENKL